MRPCPKESLRSHRRHRGHWRADGAGQAERWCGEQESGAVVGAEPGREFAQVPELAQVDAEFEQAMLVLDHRQERGAFP